MFYVQRGLPFKVRPGSGSELYIQQLRGIYAGDHSLLLSARHQARSSFALNTSLLTSSPEATAQITHAEDVAKILRQNVVQGQKLGGDGDKYRKFGYGMSYDDFSLSCAELRIHGETERGDNDSIKMAGKEVGAYPGGCCGNI
jgi:complex III assembly factor LYRM7